MAAGMRSVKLEFLRKRLLHRTEQSNQDKDQEYNVHFHRYLCISHKKPLIPLNIQKISDNILLVFSFYVNILSKFLPLQI